MSGLKILEDLVKDVNAGRCDVVSVSVNVVNEDIMVKKGDKLKLDTNGTLVYLIKVREIREGEVMTLN